MSGTDMTLFFSDFPAFSDPFDAMLPFATGASKARSNGRMAHRDMPLDVKETDKAVEVLADIPSVKKEDIQIDVDKQVLAISVNSKTEKEEKKDGVWHHTERSRNFMKRSLRMPGTADMENISAAYNDGTLTIKVPKRELPPKNKRIAIS